MNNLFFSRVPLFLPPPSKTPPKPDVFGHARQQKSLRRPTATSNKTCTTTTTTTTTTTNRQALWARLADACVKTLLTVGPMLRREYHAANPTPGGAFAATKGKPSAAGGPGAGGASGAPTPARSTCFTIIGMDLMVDDELEPWIIEINHLPSFR